MEITHEHIGWGEGHEHKEHHHLSVEKLHVHYGPVCALEDISFNLCCGKSMALLGPNGAGKSTLLKALCGLTPGNTGSIRWKNLPLKKHSMEIAYLPQREAINWEFPITVRGLVEMGRFPQLGLLKKFQQRDFEVVDRALVSMKLVDLQHRQISALSGGQQQRAFIARALAQEAHILLLDEPYTGLDTPTQQQLKDLLQELVLEGRLVIASHHDLNSVADHFDSALLINRTQVAYGSPVDVLSEAVIDQAYDSYRHGKGGS